MSRGAGEQGCKDAGIEMAVVLFALRFPLLAPRLPLSHGNLVQIAANHVVLPQMIETLHQTGNRFNPGYLRTFASEAPGFPYGTPGIFIDKTTLFTPRSD
jgi:hypothetical protein